MTNRRLRRVLGLLPLALVISLPAAPAPAAISWSTAKSKSGPSSFRTLAANKSHARRDARDVSAHAANATACAAADSSPSAGAAKLEDVVLCLVNRERRSHGLPTLRPNKRLDRAARGHSFHMVRSNFFSHDSLGGSSVMDRVKRRGYRSSRGMMVGENIAWGSGSYATPREIVAGWMRSPGHRANILHRSFREVGVGVALGAPRPVGSQPAATYTTDFGKRG